MRLFYTLTKEDYVEFNICHINNTPALKKTMGVQRIGIGLAFFLMPFVMHKITGINFNLFMITFSIIGFSWIIFYKFIFKLIMTRGVKKMLKKDEENILLGEKVLELKNKKLIKITKDKEEELLLDTIIKIIENKNNIYIYVSEIEAYIIPDKAFKDNNDRVEFLNFLKNFNDNIIIV